MNVDFDRFLLAKQRFSRPGRPALRAGSLLLRKRCAGLTIRTANNASHGRSPDAPVGGRVSQSHPPAGLIVIVQYAKEPLVSHSRRPLARDEPGQLTLRLLRRYRGPSSPIGQVLAGESYIGDHTLVMYTNIAVQLRSNIHQPRCHDCCGL